MLFLTKNLNYVFHVRNILSAISSNLSILRQSYKIYEDNNILYIVSFHFFCPTLSIVLRFDCLLLTRFENSLDLSLNIRHRKVFGALLMLHKIVHDFSYPLYNHQTPHAHHNERRFCLILIRTYVSALWFPFVSSTVQY